MQETQKQINRSEDIENDAQRDDGNNLTQPLLSTPPILSKDSILVKTLSFGLNGLFTSAYIVANGKLLAVLGSEGSGAAALISPYQSVILGTSIGFIYGIGFEVAPLIARKEYKEAGELTRATWVMAFGLGALSSAAMLATRGIFPLLFEQNTAKAATDFFTGCAIGNIPMLLLVTNVQVAFQEGDWLVPPVTAGLLFGGATTASYLLAFPGELGSFGIGLGGSVAQLVVCSGMQAWFLRSHYKKYDFYKLSGIPQFKEKIKSLLSSGWKLSVQRLTEWGNLTAITTILGIEDNNSLKATSPSAQYIALLAASFQGIAQATGMLIAKNAGAKNKALQDGNEQEARELQENNVHILLKSNGSAILISGGIAISFYFAREPLSKFFLSNETSPEVVELSETLLWANMIGLIPDAVRIVTSGALRGWKDIVQPTAISLLTMTVIGVPLGFGAGKAFSGEDSENSEAAWMFYLRDITMFISAIIIAERCRRRVFFDNANMSPSVEPQQVFINREHASSLAINQTTTTITPSFPSIQGNGFTFFSSGKKQEQGLLDSEERLNVHEEKTDHFGCTVL